LLTHPSIYFLLPADIAIYASALALQLKAEAKTVENEGDKVSTCMSSASLNGRQTGLCDAESLGEFCLR